MLMGDTGAFSYLRENHFSDLITEQGNAGFFYLHPNKKGTETFGRFRGDWIYEALSGKK